MSAEQVCDILKRVHGIDSVVENHGVICLIDISKHNIMTIRSILKDLGYNKSWGIRPSSNKQVAPLVFDDDSHEKHVV